jgi:hypothetical protein
MINGVPRKNYRRGLERSRARAMARVCIFGNFHANHTHLRLCDISESSLQTRAASMNRNTGARA